MLNRFLYIFLILLLISGCSKKEDKAPDPTISIPEISSMNGGSVRLATSDTPRLIESSTILMDDGNKIPDGTSFRLVSDVIKINSVNSSDSLTWQTSLIVTSTNGKFSFYVKPHTITGLYRVNAYPVESSNIKFDQGLNARYFINIVAGAPTSLGEIKTDYYQDLPNFNNIKDSNEKWIVTSNPDLISYIQVGPIVDSYGNLVEEGDLSVTPNNGAIISENPTKILSGYSYFSYKSNGTNGNINISAQILNHPLNSSISLNSTILSSSPQLQLMENPDFTGMTVNSTKCETVRLTNAGAMSSTQLNFESTFPFSIVDENTNDPLCPLTTDVCKLNQSLRSGEVCKLRIKLTMPNNSLSDGDLTVQVNPQEFSSSLLIQKLRTQSVQAAQLVASNPFISFGGTQCSTTRAVSIVVENIGDFDATGLVVQNPPPNNNQSNPFYSIVLPPADAVMNPNMAAVVNCGTTFPAGRKCRVEVNFNPTAGILNQALIGKILGSNINPLLLSVSGYTVPGNGLNTFPITFVTPNNSLLPLGMFIANGQQTRVDVGPVVDACNQRVADGTILSSTVSAGILSQQTLVTNNGFASFYWSAGTDISKIGIQNINVSVGVNGSKSGNLTFKGVDLQLAGLTNFNQVIQGKPKELTVTLTNNGNINAQNLSFNIGNPLVIVDTGVCASGTLNAGSSCQIIVRADPQNINQDLSVPLIISSSSLGSNSITANFLLNARTKPILTFNSNDYLFNDGTIKSTYSRDIVLTNQGPAISYDTVINVEPPFSIASTDCSSTLNVNQSCTITVNLNSSDASLAVDKKISVSNEIDTASPFANLGFSSLQFNQTKLFGIIDRCFGPYSVSIKGSSGVVNASSLSTINLSSSGGVVFYSDSSCNSGTEITTTSISSGTTVSSSFYIKGTILGSNSLLASHPTISSGFLEAQFNDEINLNIPSPNALVSNENLLLNPSGGYGNYSVTFVDGGSTSPNADLINELDVDLELTGLKILTVKTITGAQTSIVRVTDEQGFYKDFTFNLHQPVSSIGSITIQNTNSNLIPFNIYSNANNPIFTIQNYTGGNYVNGSLYSSTIDSNGSYNAGSSIGSTTEYVLIQVPKATGGFSEVRVTVTVNLQWPYGTLGDLIINSGQTVNLAAGNSYDYRSITINSGGTLNISGRGIILLGSVNNVIINGNITSDTFDECGTTFSLTDPDINATTPLTVSYSYASTGRGGNGGNGPGGHHFSGAGAGGAGCCGYGGGGGGGGGGAWSGGCCGYHSIGGSGGSCGGSGGYSYGSGNVYLFGYYGGAGMVTYGNGGNASSGSVGGGSGGGAGATGVFANAPFASHAGGGGGMKGLHRNSLFIRTKFSVLGTGFINLSGTNGFNGGTGGSPSICDFYQPGAGGGGGGGDGGSGGTVNIKYKVSNSFPLANINNNGGLRGFGGNGGISCYSSSINGGAGAHGSNGSNGTISISPF